VRAETVEATSRMQARSGGLAAYWKALPILISTFRSNCLDETGVRALQEERLRKLVDHVYRSVTFYRKLFDESGLGPSDIERLEDLGKLPLTTKSMFRALQPKSYTARGPDLRRYHKQTTSGSSGEPFSIYWDDRSAITFLTTSIRAHRWMGGRLTDHILLIGPTYYPDKLFVQKLGLGRVTLLSPMNRPELLLESYESFKPDVLLIYPSVLKSLFVAITNPRMIKHKVRMIITSGEYLDSSTRTRSEEIFGGRTFQFYGSWEIGRIANECRFRTGLHINEDVVVAEYLPSEIHQDQRKIVLTNLSNFTMPFLRYVQGDEVRVVPGRCPCGSPFARIQIVEGRQSDVIELPSGRKVSALRCLGGLSLVPGLRQFRFIQESHSRATLEILTDCTLDEACLRRALGKIEGYVQGIHITLVGVDRILPDPSGKTHKFVSRLSQTGMPD
jgi:phenylacetate-CoA ligase